MPGYSGTPLPQKLGIKDGHTVVLLGAPARFEKDLGPLPPDVNRTTSLPRGREADVILLFCMDFKALAAGFEKAAKSLRPNGGLWISWPKKSSGIPTDINENDIRQYGLAAGLVDNKVCAVTDIWSGLRFVYRVEDRPKLEASAKTVTKTTAGKRINPARAAGPTTGATSRPARSASPRARKP